MVLISHNKSFIYIKTIKTAGTSTELFFQNFCVQSNQSIKLGTNEIISEFGIVGARTPDAKSKSWFNHMPAQTVKEKLGQDKWDNYFKFCNIRNPWDKMVSLYHHQKLVSKNQSFPEFDSWIKQKHQKKAVFDIPIYTIKGEMVMDYYIRFENLTNDIQEVCRKLDLDCNISSLANEKSGIRQSKKPYCEYYSEESVNMVAELFPSLIRDFKYEF